MSGHRLTHATGGGRAKRREPHGRNQPRHAECEPDQGDAVHGDSATLQTVGGGDEIGLGHLRKDLRHPTLDGVFRATVPLERLVHVECGREETRVLAR